MVPPANGPQRDVKSEVGCCAYIRHVLESLHLGSGDFNGEALMRANFNLQWRSVLRDEVDRKGKKLASEERRQLADGLWHECVTNAAFKPVAYVGDSTSDVKAGVAYGIPVIVILHGDSNSERLREAGAALTVKSLCRF